MNTVSISPGTRSCLDHSRDTMLFRHHLAALHHTPEEAIAFLGFFTAYTFANGEPYYLGDPLGEHRQSPTEAAAVAATLADLAKKAQKEAPTP